MLGYCIVKWDDEWKVRAEKREMLMISMTIAKIGHLTNPAIGPSNPVLKKAARRQVAYIV